MSLQSVMFFYLTLFCPGGRPRKKLGLNFPNLLNNKRNSIIIDAYLSQMPKNDVNKKIHGRTLTKTIKYVLLRKTNVFSRADRHIA